MKNENNKAVEEFRALNAKSAAVATSEPKQFNSTTKMISRRQNSLKEQMNNLGIGLNKLKDARPQNKRSVSNRQQKQSEPKQLFDLFDLDSIEDEIQAQNKLN